MRLHRSIALARVENTPTIRVASIGAVMLQDVYEGEGWFLHGLGFAGSP